MAASAEPKTYKNYTTRKRLNDYKTTTPNNWHSFWGSLWNTQRRSRYLHTARIIWTKNWTRNTKPTPKSAIFINNSNWRLTYVKINKTFLCASLGKQPLLDNDVFNHLTTDEGTKVLHYNLSTKLTLKKERHLHYFHMDFEKLTLNGLFDTGVITTFLCEADLNKIKLIERSIRRNWTSAQFFKSR